MSDPPPDAVTKVARDLTEILALYAHLRDQAVNDSGARLMPGGRAMVELGNVANLEAWGHMQGTTERTGRAYTSTEDEDPDEAWSAFQLLEFWSEGWRREHDAEYGRRPSIASEANFIRYLLPWAWENEPAWEEFAADVRRARLRLEDILFDGTRPERSRVECDRCDASPRLLVLRGQGADDADLWKCPGCKTRLEEDDVRRAHTTMLRSAGAERWLHQADAIGLLVGQDRPESTVRKWLSEGEGDGYCDPVTHEVWCWWPSLWRKHLMTPTRKRTPA